MIQPGISHPWNLSVAEAEALQRQLAGRVETSDRLPQSIGLVAGTDVAYETAGDWLIAAVTVLDARTLEVVESATHEDRGVFPYVPGLFSFREMPPLAAALGKLSRMPDLIVCDGQGLAHPRRFGLACHLGVLFDVPAIGCAKSRLFGDHDTPGLRRGESAPLTHEGAVIGAALRTREGIKPVFVSVGHRISLPTACEWILRLAVKHRLPEPVREANQLANQLRHNRGKA